MNKKRYTSTLRLVLIILFGWTGWQRFEKKKYISGTIFLLTGGLLLVGWALDIYAEVRKKDFLFFNM